jgi:STE24 endopeptidase
MEETSTRAKQYSRCKTWLIIIQLLLTTIFLITMLLSGVSVLIRNLAASWSRNFYLQIAIYLTLFSSIYYLLFVWLDFYGNFLLEHKFLLSNQTIQDWLKKSSKKGLLSFLIFLILGEAVYFFLRHFPNYWWLLATAMWLLFTIVLAKVMPILIIPLFYKCSPLAEGELKERILKLGKICGVNIREVFKVQLSKDTRKANAAVAGFGKGRRILLGDTLLNNYSDEEIEAIFAHELGHICLFHTWKIFGIVSVVSLASFYMTFLLFKAEVSFLAFNEVYNVAAFPLLVLILMAVGLILMPIQQGYLRHLEKQADIFAIDHIQNKQSFVSAMTRLAGQNLSDPSPSKWEVIFLYDHPPILERLRYASSVKTEIPR